MRGETGCATGLPERSDIFHPRVSRPHSAHSRYMRPRTHRTRSSWPIIRHLTANLHIATTSIESPRSRASADAGRERRHHEPHHTDDREAEQQDGDRYNERKNDESDEIAYHAPRPTHDQLRFPTL